MNDSLHKFVYYFEKYFNPRNFDYLEELVSRLEVVTWCNSQDTRLICCLYSKSGVPHVDFNDNFMHHMIRLLDVYKFVCNLLNRSIDQKFEVFYE